ncbi:hypothetical protein HanXRQr2_Chr07g0280661 [Helianthus annuus]|uniref:Uncharacterized protein n=1 Tax=Helianthus annuus TaxID=4232 RepID=A0A9K3IIN8_HELAN|nr:hypothetical protein HanXRQr2_Chr07g0280661 [Helianthus annuus]
MYKLLKTIEIGISTKFKTPKGHSRDFIHRNPILLIIYHQLNKMPPISRRKPTTFIFILPSSSSSLIKPVRVLHFHCFA